MSDLPADDILEDDGCGDEESPAAEVEPKTIELTIGQELAGTRLDVYVSDRFARISRSAVQRLIKTSSILVNGSKSKPSHALAKGDRVFVELSPPPPYELTPEYMPLDILYEDEIMLVVNKPAGIVVHPSRGHGSGTLINAVLYHCRHLSHLAPGRPGVVHRLDRNTTGVILFMKDDWAHRHVARQFEYRRTRKEYWAIVEGEMEYESGSVSFPIGRHRTNSQKMAVRMEDGREAQTSYKVLERFRGYTFISAMPRTGRTHQIRVHLEALGHPVAADEFYSKSGLVYLSELKGRHSHPSDEAPLMARQALHAHRLNIEYPGKGERIEFIAPLPEDMETFLAALRKYRAL